jgi:hypothetical protein
MNSGVFDAVRRDRKPAPHNRKESRPLEKCHKTPSARACIFFTDVPAARRAPRICIRGDGAHSAAMRILFLAAAFFAVAGALRAQAEIHYSKPDVRKEITTVVEAQLSALRAEDFRSAYQYAVQRLRRRLSAEQFAEMIRRGYPAIVGSERAELGLPMDDGLRAIVSVRVFAKSGAFADFRYTLLKERTGWRIAEVIAERSRESDV